MTGRNAPPSRSTMPPDPSLTFRPVPRKRTFPIRSFGQGATNDNPYESSNPQARNDFWDSLDREAPAEDDDPHENRSLLHTIRSWEAVTWRDDQRLTPQPTWGYYVFLTDYGQHVRDALPRAMENWVKAIQRIQGADTDIDPYDRFAHEVFVRLKLDLVEDEVALQHASPDRVRECFRALIRSLELADNEDQWVPPTRNKICLMLDADAIEMLAGLSFDYDDRNEEHRALDQCRVRAVDIAWDRPETTTSSYRGVRNISIIGLARVYSMLANGAFMLDDYSE